MEIKFFETSLVKEKFALLIAKLHSVGLLTDYINDTIVKSPFFDCFEKNVIEDFMNLSFENITKVVFKKDVIYDYSLNYVNDYYWAGLSVMNIMMNLEIPLKRILLIMPLKEIVGAYNLYHEMHVEQFLKHYSELENERCLLKILRNSVDLSISKISYLTGIKTSILSLMDYSNATLFGTSFSNLSKLSFLFKLPIDIFRKKSLFVPFSQYIFESKSFEPILVKNILDYFNIKEETTYTIIYNYVDEKEIKMLLKENKVIIDLSNPFGVIYLSSNRHTRKYLSKEEMSFIYKTSIETLKTQLNELIF